MTVLALETMVQDGSVNNVGIELLVNNSLVIEKEKVYISSKEGNTKGEESLEEEIIIRLEGHETTD